ncbi:MAG: PD-(D/E)XK nuclease family protein [Mariniphaga sp.]
MKETIDEELCNQLLDDFRKLTFKERKNPTFLEIIKQPNREVHWSNILAFYLDPNREHNLDDLMLRSFFDALGESVKIENPKKIEVHPNFRTLEGKYIDLVVIADNFVIAIENKVYAPLYNPLEDYGNEIDKMAKKLKCVSFKVVLSIAHYNEIQEFKNLTYECFIKHIKKNLPIYESNANAEYLMFFKNFLKNIENTIKFKEMIDNKESLEYFQNNYEAIEQLTSKFEKTKSEAYAKFKEIHDVINPAKLEASIKDKYKINVRIEKSIDIEWVDGIIAFWMYIHTPEGNIKIEIAVYSLIICCSADTINEIYQNRINESKDYKIELDICDDVKITADTILNFIKKIGGIVFAE